jgi:hypothetical protein
MLQLTLASSGNPVFVSPRHISELHEQTHPLYGEITIIYIAGDHHHIEVREHAREIVDQIKCLGD